MNGIWICVYTDTLVGYPTHLYDDSLDDYNLSYIEVKEDVLFDWFKANILEDFRADFDIAEGISDRGVMDEWLDEYTADDTVGLYDYMKEHNGLIR